MTKEQMIAALGGNPEGRPATLPVVKCVPSLMVDRIHNAFFQDDKQKAFFDTLAILAENADGTPVALSDEIRKSFAHAVLLAHYGRAFPTSARLIGFTFTKQGFFPCSIAMTPDSIGLASPREFPINKLSPWGTPPKEELFSPEVVVAKAKELTSLFQKQFERSPFSFYVDQKPELLADVIWNAVDAIAKE